MINDFFNILLPQFCIATFVLIEIIMAIFVIILALLDDTIHDEEYILKNYDYPILARIPDLVNSGGKKYGYYYKRSNE